MSKRRVANVAGVALAVALVVGFGLARVVDVGGSPAGSCDDPVAWDDADARVGESAAVAGRVAAANHEPEVGGAPTFLNIGGAYPDPERFDVVVYADVRAEFDDPPEEALVGERVCVQGRVRERDGVPQIVLEGPEWLVTR